MLSVKYGPGIASYFDMMIQLMRVYCIITIFALIMMYIYHSMGGRNYMEFDNQITQDFSFGNMGYPQAFCEYNLLTPGQTNVNMEFQCQTTTGTPC